MKAMKFRVKDAEHSKKIQEALFAEGYNWWSGSKVQPQYLDADFLYANENGSMAFGTLMLGFVGSHNPEYELFYDSIQPVEALPQPANYPKMPAVKQPNGLRPKCIVDALRVKEILEAMSRYAADGHKIPQEWLDELGELNGG